MATWLLAFLKLLERDIPPPRGCHHGIGVKSYGSDETGWAQRLSLHVMLPAARHEQFQHQTFFLDDADFTKEPSTLVLEIRMALVKELTETRQI